MTCIGLGNLYLYNDNNIININQEMFTMYISYTSINIIIYIFLHKIKFSKTNIILTIIFYFNTCFFMIYITYTLMSNFIIQLMVAIL